jgi:hypothetical protein
MRQRSSIWQPQHWELRVAYPWPARTASTLSGEVVLSCRSPDVIYDCSMDDEARSEPDSDAKPDRTGISPGAAIAVGAGVGAALLAATGSPVWIAIGVAIGAALGGAAGTDRS